MMCFSSFEFRDAITQQSADPVGPFRRPLPRGRHGTTAEQQRVQRGQSQRSQFSFRCDAWRVRDESSLRRIHARRYFFRSADRYRRLIDAQHARRLTGAGTDAAGKLRKNYWWREVGERLLPAAAINKVVPIRNEVAHRTSRLAKGTPQSMQRAPCFRSFSSGKS